MWNRTKKKRSMLFSNSKLKRHVPMRQWRLMGNVFIVWHSQKVALPWVNAYFRSVFLMGNCIMWNMWETPFVMAMWTYYVVTHNNVKNHLIWTYFHVSNLTLQNQTTNIVLRFLKLFPHLLTHTSTLCKRWHHVNAPFLELISKIVRIISIGKKRRKHLVL
jgi:hypothetical protein